MMIPNRFQQRVEKPKNEDCEIEIKKTASGRKIRFKGKCSKEQVQVLMRENGLEE